MENSYKNIQDAVNSVLNVQSFVKKKTGNKVEKKREQFVQIINMIEEAIVRSNIMYSEMQVDFSQYDEKFFIIIDNLLFATYGPECYDLISFYLWERMDENGDSVSLMDTFGNHIEFKSPYDLWEAIIKINSKLK